MQAYGSDQQVKVVCTGMHCASGACAACAAEPVHVFEDPAIEAAVRAKLNKPTGALSAQDLSSVTSLSLSDTALTSLSDLKMLSGLKNLKLKHCGISDLSALKEMTQLSLLDMPSNQIIDLTPLSGLTNLNTLGLSDNLISDLTPLSGLTKMDTLYLYKNRIEDIRPLETLKDLTFLNLRANRIVDTSPLLSLPKLETLDLSENPTTTIAPSPEPTRKPTPSPTAKPTAKPTANTPSIISGTTLMSPSEYLGITINPKGSSKRSSKNGFDSYSYYAAPVKEIKRYVSALKNSGQFKITSSQPDEIIDDWLVYKLKYIGDNGKGNVEITLYNRHFQSCTFNVSVSGDLTMDEGSLNRTNTDKGISCSVCGGDGKCDRCGGDGYMRKTNWVKGSPVFSTEFCDSITCRSGKCTRCGGDGQI